MKEKGKQSLSEETPGRIFGEDFGFYSKYEENSVGIFKKESDRNWF